MTRQDIRNRVAEYLAPRALPHLKLPLSQGSDALAELLLCELLKSAMDQTFDLLAELDTLRGPSSN